MQMSADNVQTRANSAYKVLAHRQRLKAGRARALFFGRMDIAAEPEITKRFAFANSKRDVPEQWVLFKGG